MKKSHIVIGIVALIIFIAGAAYVVATQGTASSATSAPVETTNPNAVTPPVDVTTPVTIPPVSTAPTLMGYTLAQVQTHNSQSSCWSAINSNVYDLTSWINQHPGGPQAILSICGKDGSAAFNDQHGGQRRPADELAGFLIGALAK